MKCSYQHHPDLENSIIQDTRPLPPRAATEEEDQAQLSNYPWVDGTIYADYGYNLKYVLIGPNCSFYSGTHPLDPFLRNGTNGPESGKPIKIGEDCWFGGNCIVLPGVTIGRGVTVGAGSVVTKDVPDFVVVVGNPARILKKIEVKQSGNQNGHVRGSEVLVGEHTEQAEKTL